MGESHQLASLNPSALNPEKGNTIPAFLTSEKSTGTQTELEIFKVEALNICPTGAIPGA